MYVIKLKIFLNPETDKLRLKRSSLFFTSRKNNSDCDQNDGYNNDTVLQEYSS